MNQDALIQDITRDVFANAVAMQATKPTRVIDGNTPAIAGTSFRTSGIDAPEMGRPCTNAEGTGFDCGTAARRSFEQTISGHEVTCKAYTVDIYKRPIKTCSAEGQDLGSSMVFAGLAVPFKKYSNACVEAGTTARLELIGLRSTTLDMPWDYRKAN